MQCKTAKMHGLNWQDLRVALALSRAGSRAGAARMLGVDETTVARRIAVLESALGSALFLKGARGGVIPTAIGETALNHAARIEAEVRAITGATAEPELRGHVRLTAVPVLINRLLVPEIASLLRDAPELTVDLIPEARNLDLTKREADLALRWAKPEAGGQHLVTRRLCDLSFGVYGRLGTSDGFPWIEYAEGSRHLPQARWQKGLAPVTALRVADLETAIEAVAAGLGQALLPTAIAKRDSRLERLVDPDPPIAREVWLLAHRDQRHLPAIQAVMDWIMALDW